MMLSLKNIANCFDKLKQFGVPRSCRKLTNNRIKTTG